MKSFNQILAIVLSLLIAVPAFPQASVVAQQSQDVNYVQNGGFENSKAGWSAYKNTAQVLPVTGSGGTPTTTVTSSTSAPISGKSSGLLTKPASNVQGEGISYAFALDSAAKGRVLSISGLYQIISGTYSGGTPTTDSDVEVYIYDVDSAQVIQPAGYKLDGGVSGINYPIAATFQTNLTSTNYRLIFQVASTSASAYTLKLDQIKIGIPNKSQGPPVTDWIAYTPTTTGFGTISSQGFYWRRDGDSIEVTGTFVCGATTATTASISIPNGLTISATKFPSGIAVVGNLSYNQSAAASYYTLGVPGSSVLNFGVSSGGTPGLSPSTGINIAGNTSTLSFQAKFPVTGWSSTVTMSDSADTRVIAARYYVGTGTSTTAGTPINFDSQVYDKTSSVTTGAGTWKYTAPAPGIYELSGVLNASGTATYYIYKNGVSLQTCATASVANVGYTFSQSVQLNAGDYIDIRPDGNLTPNGGAIGTTAININRLSGPSQVAASESVSAQYTNASGFSVPNNANTTISSGWTKVKDSHGGFSNGVYTLPVSGTYLVSLGIGFVANGTGVRGPIIQQGGSSTALYYETFTGSSTGSIGANVTSMIVGSAGDTISLQAFQSSGGALALVNNSGQNFFSITRVGN